MNNSTLYRIHAEQKLLQAVKEIDFSDFNFKERFDIQEWIESTPQILGEELLIIAKELTYFDNTKERPDLIALDKSGNIVIIELKRDDSGTGLEWQAIKYASYLSKFKAKDLVDIYSMYLERYQKEIDISYDEVSQKILDFIEKDNLESLNTSQRLILVSHRFAREVTSAVHWLIDKQGMDIKVVQLIPYFDKDRDTHYLQANTILPLPGEEDLIIKASGDKDKIKNLNFGPVKKSDEITSFFEDIKEKLFEKLERKITPTKVSRWAGIGNNFRYYHFWYDNSLWENWYLSYKVWLFDDNYSRKDRREKFGIFFDYQNKYLLNNGITEGTINEINSFLKRFKEGGFQYGELNKNNYIEKYVPVDGLSEKSKIQVVDDLNFLIINTKERIDELLLKP